MPIGFTRLQAPGYRPDLQTAKTAEAKSQPNLQMTHVDEVRFSGKPTEAATHPDPTFSPRRILARLWNFLLTPIRWPLAKFGIGQTPKEPVVPTPLHGKTLPKNENPFSAQGLETSSASGTSDADTQILESKRQSSKPSQVDSTKTGEISPESLREESARSRQPDQQPDEATPLPLGIPNVQNRSQRFWNAIYAGQPEPIREFIRQGIDVNAPQVNGATPLYEASARGNLPIVLALLESPNIEVDAADEQGTRAIHKAVIGNHPEVVDALVAKGADLEALSWYQDTPLQLASDLGHEEIAKRLIRHGAEVDGQSWQDYTPLYLAANQGHLNIARELLAHKAKVTITNQYGETPLHAAARGGHKAIMKELLAAEGANPNAQDNRGETPLHRAASKDHLEVLEALVAQGGDLHLKSGKGVTPMDILEKRRAIRETESFDRLPL